MCSSLFLVFFCFFTTELFKYCSNIPNTNVYASTFSGCDVHLSLENEFTDTNFLSILNCMKIYEHVHVMIFTHSQDFFFQHSCHIVECNIVLDMKFHGYSILIFGLTNLSVKDGGEKRSVLLTEKKQIKVFVALHQVLGYQQLSFQWQSYKT